jgi:hypothetical protein
MTLSEESLRDPGPDTVSLGRFDALELPIILDVLKEHGIFAMTKSPLDEAELSPYPMFSGDRETLLVERGRADEARRLIETEVRTIETEIRDGLGPAGDDATAEDLVPFGWLEPDVARELLRVLAGSDIRAASEYPLDVPAPPYARADGRVRVHVEEMFLDDAAELLETDVRKALAARGVAVAEPLREEDS